MTHKNYKVSLGVYKKEFYADFSLLKIVEIKVMKKVTGKKHAKT
jgi:hypothetical protein